MEVQPSESLAQGLTIMLPCGVCVPTTVPSSLATAHFKAGMQPDSTGGQEGLFSGGTRGGGIRGPVR